MLLDPVPTPVASPLVLIVTAAELDEDHVAELVRFCVVPSLNVPVAVNCSLVPLAIEAFAVVIVIDCSVAAVTAKGRAFDVMPFSAAVTLVDPTASPLARPLVLIVAALVLEESHVVDAVKFCVVPSLKVPIAVN